MLFVNIILSYLQISLYKILEGIDHVSGMENLDVFLVGSQWIYRLIRGEMNLIIMCFLNQEHSTYVGISCIVIYVLKLI